MGHEITPLAKDSKRCHQASNGTRSIEWKEVLAAKRRLSKPEDWLPDETMEAFREYIVDVKGR